MTKDEGRAARPRTRQLAPWQAFCLQSSVVVFFLAGGERSHPAVCHLPAAVALLADHHHGDLRCVRRGHSAGPARRRLLSDHVGRRPVIFCSIVVQAVAVVVFASADGVPALLCHRILQGLATGTVVGAVGAGMIDVDRSAGTLANAVAPAVGTAVGALGSGLLVACAPQPAHLVHHVLLVVQALGVLFMAETAAALPILKFQTTAAKYQEGPSGSNSGGAFLIFGAHQCRDLNYPSDTPFRRSPTEIQRSTAISMTGILL
ncbi:MFS transporter [Streptomyces shenzhenensis]|uniref:hypothetical protein n=1 Tax=Streptomyces shenzhenensis TaxID=943815 RepID=UPI0015F1010D|nr:hypothetical protein [Streptomyces shenzhenensis]